MRVENVGTETCPGCGATLLAGLRFCRMCGYRLGEGVEEFIPTQRLDAAAPPRATDPFAARQTWGPPARQTFGTAPLRQAGDAAARSLARACRPSRGGWITWFVLLVALLSASGVVTRSVSERVAGGLKQAQALPSNSILKEVDDIETADGGGVFITGLSGPDSSLERAGISGGDVIKSLDGQPVANTSALRKILAATPPGKTVAVTFVHDDELKTATLTTADERDFHGMSLIDARPGGQGRIGVDVGNRVRVDGSNVYGVEVDGVTRNGPADLAGLKRGDILTEFDGKPVRTPGDMRLRIWSATPGDTVKAVVVRNGQRLEISVKMGRQRG
jgi:membrane-associated protease RseP (regulator of RpoE activity)